VISNRAAEHLAQEASGVEAIIQRCYEWFGDNALPVPAFYVPPAWALGPIGRARLKQLPFRFYETLIGVYDAGEARLHRLPLLGFEADRPWRARALRLNNHVQRRWASWRGRWRVAIHPQDLKGPLAIDLLREINALTICK